MNEETKKQLGLRIKALRKNENISQEDLAEICDVSWRSVSNLERGKCTPDMRFICALAKHFSISIDALLCFDESDKKTSPRQTKENLLFAKIQNADDKMLDFLSDYIDLACKNFSSK